MRLGKLIPLIFCVGAMGVIGASAPNGGSEPVSHGFEPIVIGPQPGTTGLGTSGGHNTGNTGGHNTGNTGGHHGNAPMRFANSIWLGVGTDGPVPPNKTAKVEFRVYEERTEHGQTVLEEIPRNTNNKITSWGLSARPHQNFHYFKPKDNGKGPLGSAAGMVDKLEFASGMKDHWVVFEAQLKKDYLSGSQAADYHGWKTTYRWKVH
ncbi:MAG TPA: hypothetical protein VK934_09075 [Fimbriimonas sp.]|nr:hypothetical protein [Fimbriimonas sp.]